MAKVFVVQKQMRFDKTKGELVPRFDSIEKAAEFGEMVYLLSPTAGPFNINDGIIDELHEALEDYTSDDYLLLIGNPSLIMTVGIIAHNYNIGQVNCLQWSGKEQRYIPITIYTDIV